MTMTNSEFREIRLTKKQFHAKAECVNKRYAPQQREARRSLPAILTDLRFFTFLLVSLFTFIGLSTHGEVTTKDRSGFSTFASVDIAANSNQVYDKIGQISSWWDSNHTFSGDSKNLRIELTPGGCFCESFGDKDGVMHLQVIYAKRGRFLRLQGGLGPLQALGAHGTLTIEFHERDGVTTLVFKYTVHGRGLTDLAEPVDRVLGEQFERLKRTIELGQPEKLELREQ